MSRTTLEKLLQDADASAGVPGPQAGLALSIRRLHRRRTIVRSTAVAAVATVGLVVAVVMTLPERATPRDTVAREAIPSAPSLAALADEMVAVSQEANRRDALVDRLLAAEQRVIGRRDRRRGPDPLAGVRREQDRAALLLIHEADRLTHAAHAKTRAAEEYRRVVELYPETHWAAVARQRLIELDGSSRLAIQISEIAS